jgi:hypothetical protein
MADKYVKVKLEDGTLIEKLLIAVPAGNFQMLFVKHDDKIYVIDEGNQYPNGIPEYYPIGRRIS